MDNFDHIATQGEAYRELISNLAIDNPNVCWLKTPYDTWERNPNYTGPEVPHPECDEDFYPAEAFVLEPPIDDDFRVDEPDDDRYSPFEDSIEYHESFGDTH
jgi:hypothetical protein